MGRRGQKKHYVQTLTKKDEAMLKAFRACGYLTRDMLKEKLTMADNRIKNFERDGHITKVSFLDKNQNKAIETFKLTDTGKSFIEQNLGLVNAYRSTSIAHDLELAKRYMNCSETERDTWKTEADLRDQYKEMVDDMRENHYEEYFRLQEYLQENDISVVDGSYISDETGMEMSAEVITDHYGRAEIEAKVVFCHVMNINQK